MQPIFDETYKRGLASTRVEVFPDTIRVTRGQKDVREVAIADIRRLNYYTAPSKYSHYHCFWIDAGDTRLYVQGSEHGPLADPEGAFHRSFSAILRHLAAKRPELRVSSEAGMAVRWSYFIVFGLCGLLAVVLGGIVLTEEIFPGLMMLVVGLPFLPLAWAFRPWGERPSIAIGEVLAAANAMA